MNAVNAGGVPNVNLVVLDLCVVSIDRIDRSSIRLEPHTSADVNNAIEVDASWLPYKPGDHIVAKVWIKVGLPAGYVHPSDPWQVRGTRLGLDLLFRDSTGILYIVVALPESSLGSYVEWGTDGWVQQVFDFIVPSNYYTKDIETGTTFPAVQISHFVIWGQARFATDAANAWFDRSIPIYRCLFNP